MRPPLTHYVSVTVGLIGYGCAVRARGRAHAVSRAAYNLRAIAGARELLLWARRSGRVIGVSPLLQRYQGDGR